MERSITRAMVEHFTACQVVHAGAVASNGQGVLLPADSGSGKSTLVAALAFSGFDYFTDEAAILARGGFLLPYPKVITLKEDGWQAVTDIFARVKDSTYFPVREKGLHHVVAPNLPDSRHGQSGSSVDLIVIPRYSHDESTSLQSIPRSVALAQLVRQSLNLAGMDKDGFDILHEVVLQSKCYALTLNDLREAVRLLADLTCSQN